MSRLGSIFVVLSIGVAAGFASAHVWSGAVGAGGIALMVVAEEICEAIIELPRGFRRPLPSLVQITLLPIDAHFAMLAVWSNGDTFLSNDCGRTWERYYGVPKAVNE
jgi:hypothetical protein